MTDKFIDELRAVHAKLADLETTDSDEFCTFDAYNDRYVVEMKDRGWTKYPDTLIEYHKVEANRDSDRTLLYAVKNCGKIYIFNVTKLERDGYDFRWEKRMLPATTFFARKEWIEKYVGYIKWEDAIYVHDLT